MTVQEEVVAAMAPALAEIQHENRVRNLVASAARLFRSWENVERSVTCALEIEASVRRRIQLTKEQLGHE